MVKNDRPSKHSSIEKSAADPRKKAAGATPCNDICHNQVGHWPEAVERKQRFHFAKLNHVPSVQSVKFRYTF